VFKPVSSLHSTLHPRAVGVWVEDAGSTNGTFVNGAPVTSRRLLQPGDVVRIGHTDLLVEA
jgi:pSer/pThr/pTyr-binding forkhead associated (FHA) protein